MPSHSILPQARRAAIEAAFDEALAEVRAAGDVALLQECRAIFRKRVPLHLRAYVAAALALRGSGRQQDHRRQGAEPSRKNQEPREARNQRSPRGDNGDDRKDGKQGKAQALPAAAPRKADRIRQEPEPRKEPEPRENRYRGEGVTLFVSAGRRQRFYARVAVKIMQEIPGVTGDEIGDIRTMDNYSFIVVDPSVEDIVIEALHGYDFKGRILAVNRARKKGEPAPAVEGESPLERNGYRPAATEGGPASVSGGYGDDEGHSGGDYGDDADLADDGMSSSLDADDDGLDAGSGGSDDDFDDEPLSDDDALSDDDDGYGDEEDEAGLDDDKDDGDDESTGNA